MAWHHQEWCLCSSSSSSSSSSCSSGKVRLAWVPMCGSSTVVAVHQVMGAAWRKMQSILKQSGFKRCWQGAGHLEAVLLWAGRRCKRGAPLLVPVGAVLLAQDSVLALVPHLAFTIHVITTRVAAVLVALAVHQCRQHKHKRGLNSSNSNISSNSTIDTTNSSSSSSSSRGSNHLAAVFKAAANSAVSAIPSSILHNQIRAKTCFRSCTAAAAAVLAAGTKARQAGLAAAATAQVQWVVANDAESHSQTWALTRGQK